MAFDLPSGKEGSTRWQASRCTGFKLINPLLGNNCYVGSTNQPVVISPNISLAPGGSLEELPDLWTRLVGTRTGRASAKIRRRSHRLVQGAADSLFIYR